MMKFVAWQQDDSDVKVKSFREAVIFRLHYSSPLAFVVANNKHFLLGLFSLSRCIIKSLQAEEEESLQPSGSL
jgi:hypothetical protein